MQQPRRRGSRAMYSTVNGHMVDAHVHEPILEDPIAHARSCVEAVERAMREHGLDRREAERMYGARR